MSTALMTRPAGGRASDKHAGTDVLFESISRGQVELTSALSNVDCDLEATSTLLLDLATDAAVRSVLGPDAGFRPLSQWTETVASLTPGIVRLHAACVHVGPRVATIRTTLAGASGDLLALSTLTVQRLG
ncbi:hypothetical protein [Nocardioides daeguensis]|uniref:PaaI family thioesterase n=1 Tax=Nocardioides daeguensis TaxID=908359 RepID=A0ABP6UYQ3_9ACTN|nr:hypothetical protein [Nocardioides daeguensis]MBV6728808.1 hypothetical protein [Nocardioides daeguensis]MCR1773582.1 hypothetical protein [Nocardioides daeguensis]